MAWSRPCVWLLRLTGLLAVTCTSALSRPTDGDVVDEKNLLLGSGVILNALPLAQTLQQKVIKKDFDIEDGEEESRSNGITEGGTYRKEMVMNVPVVRLLPSLAPHSASSRRGQPSESGRGSEVSSSSPSPPPGGLLHLRGRRRRVDSPSNSVPGSTMAGHITHGPWDKQYRYDRDWGGRMSRLDAYFHLGVYDIQCRRKFLCQMHDDPERLAPMPQLSASELRTGSRLKKPLSPSDAFWRFPSPQEVAAVSSSSTTFSSSCAQQYPACPISASDVINPQVLLVWRDLANSVLIRLSDE